MENLQELDKKTQIRRGLPIQECGLTFYPIMMKDFETFTVCKDSLLLRQSSFPARYLTKPFLSAVWAMEVDAVTSGKPSSGTLWRILTFLFMALRIDMDETVVRDCVVCDGKSGDLISLKVTQGENTVEISPLMFSAQIKPLLAEMNGLRLPDETQDPRLVADAEEKRKSQDADVKLDINYDDMLASVAAQCRIDPEIIESEWTVRKFELMRRAIHREKNYTAYKQAEMSGFVSFKSGNPYPSWEFDRLDDSLGMIALSKTAVGAFAKGASVGGTASNTNQS